MNRLRPQYLAIPFPGILVLVATLLLLGLAVLACGPADQSARGEVGTLPAMAPQEGGDESECNLTEGNYPTLDATLQDLVQQYETCALTEEEAAALAPDHAGPRVLVSIDAPGEDLEKLAVWMDAQNINPNYVGIDDLIAYAYPKVSVLGALSQRDGVTEVEALKPPGIPRLEGDESEPDSNATPIIAYPKPPLPVVKDADGIDLPELPGWLKGYPHPRTYHEYTAVLGILMAQYDNGEITDDDIHDLNQLVGCSASDGKVHLILEAKDTPEDILVAHNWLTAQGIEWRDESLALEPGLHLIFASLTLQQIKDVVEIADSARAQFYSCDLQPGGFSWQEELEMRRMEREAK